MIVVPVGPGNYDYYDRFLGHERRYARGELARKARAAGLEVLEDIHLGAPLYPAFWLVKQRNRRRHEHLQGEALKRGCASDIAQHAATPRSVALACALERAAARARRRAAVRDPRSDRACRPQERAMSTSRAPVDSTRTDGSRGGMLSIVIPAYNEEDNVAQRLRAPERGPGRGSASTGS